jgi:hypothetical protein
MESGHLRAIGFDSLVRFLKDPPVLEATKKFVDTLAACCEGNWEFPSPPVVLQREIKHRVLLAAYMLALYPTESLEDHTLPNIQLLLGSAICITRQIDRITEYMDSALVVTQEEEELNRSLPVETLNHLATLADGFCRNLYDYEDKFHLWKSSDTEGLVQRIYRALVLLLEAMIQFTGDVNPFDFTVPMMIELRISMNRLQQKLHELGARTEFDAFNDLFMEVEIRSQQLRTLREEHSRNGLVVDEARHGFDFIES